METFNSSRANSSPGFAPPTIDEWSERSNIRRVTFIRRVIEKPRENVEKKLHEDLHNYYSKREISAELPNKTQKENNYSDQIQQRISQIRAKLFKVKMSHRIYLSPEFSISDFNYRELLKSVIKVLDVYKSRKISINHTFFTRLTKAYKMQYVQSCLSAKTPISLPFDSYILKSSDYKLDFKNRKFLDSLKIVILGQPENFLEQFCSSISSLVRKKSRVKKQLQVVDNFLLRITNQVLHSSYIRRKFSVKSLNGASLLTSFVTFTLGHSNNIELDSQSAIQVIGVFEREMEFRNLKEFSTLSSLYQINQQICNYLIKIMLFILEVNMKLNFSNREHSNSSILEYIFEFLDKSSDLLDSEDLIKFKILYFRNFWCKEAMVLNILRIHEIIEIMENKNIKNVKFGYFRPLIVMNEVDCRQLFEFCNFLLLNSTDGAEEDTKMKSAKKLRKISEYDNFSHREFSMHFINYLFIKNFKDLRIGDLRNISISILSEYLRFWTTLDFKITISFLKSSSKNLSNQRDTKSAIDYVKSMIHNIFDSFTLLDFRKLLDDVSLPRHEDSMSNLDLILQLQSFFLSLLKMDIDSYDLFADNNLVIILVVFVKIIYGNSSPSSSPYMTDLDCCKDMPFPLALCLKIHNCQKPMNLCNSKNHSLFLRISKDLFNQHLKSMSNETEINHYRTFHFPQFSCFS
ncbi:MAG: hypothetical protein MHMPM18_001009 [Marteilia pararefringens]